MNIRRSISATLEYARFFHFPLTRKEVHRWLISPRRVAWTEVVSHLDRGLTKKDKKTRYFLKRNTKQKLFHAQKLVKILHLVPGLRLVALTGSVAIGNSQPSDDIDLLFVTSPHTLWIVRPTVLLLISLFFRRRHPGDSPTTVADSFCPNLWLDTLAISVPKHKRNLYTAHEVLQVMPLLDRNHTHHYFLSQNRWVKKYLANAFTQAIQDKEGSPQATSHSIYTYLLMPINTFLFLLQSIYMFPKKTTETVNLHSAYLHTTDFATQLKRHLNRKLDI